jgi:predicted outer membrane repeat protein
MRKLKAFSIFTSLVLSLGLCALALLWTADGSSSLAITTATTWYVNADTGDDDHNDCQTPTTACATVGAAVGKASPGDTIQIAPGIYPENLTVQDLTLVGAGMESTFLDGDNAGRVLTTNGEVILSDVTVQNGQVGGFFGGAGIYNGDTLTLQNVRVFSNTAQNGGGIFSNGILVLHDSQVLSNTASSLGGGIMSYGSARAITITNSLIAWNSASGDGGGLYVSSTPVTTMSVALTDSTVRDNHSNAAGGGLALYGDIVSLGRTLIHNNQAGQYGGGIFSVQTALTLTNVTVSENTAPSRSGIDNSTSSQTTILNSTIAYNQSGGVGNSSATISLRNTIIANNQGRNCLGSGTWTSLGHNLSSDGTCDLTQGDDLQNTSPSLAALGDYGGANLTYALLPGSPAIDAGDAANCPPDDQRGRSRPFDGDGDSVAVCDIGAYEAHRQLIVEDVTTTEGDSGFSTAYFTVTLAPAATQQTTVSYTTADGTASAGSDYTAASGTLTFQVGQSTRLISITVHGDTNDEVDETFTVHLSNASGADIVDAQATCTIVDDDGFASLTVNDQTVIEGNSGTVSAVFTVTLSPPQASAVTVDVTSQDGTAQTGADYAVIDQSLAFTPGQTTQAVTVTVYGDTIDEGGAEWFTLVLSNAVNAIIGDAEGQGTITDDDTATVYNTGGSEVWEGVGLETTPAVFTATLSLPTSFAVTVDYAT